MTSRKPPTKMSRSSLNAIISLIVLPGIFCSYCSPACHTPCQPRVRQENITTAVVDWAHLWPDLPRDCVSRVTLTANGEICFIDPGINLIIRKIKNKWKKIGSQFSEIMYFKKPNKRNWICDRL
jgi:hypothetical protein